MIKITYSPQQSDFCTADYVVVGDTCLKITMNGVVEEFDLKDINHIEELQIKSLPINPFVEITNDESINVKVIKYYGENERHLFERY